MVIYMSKMSLDMYPNAVSFSNSSMYICIYVRLNEYERTLLLLARVEELSPADDKPLFDWRFIDPTRYEKHFMIKAVVVTDS